MRRIGYFVLLPMAFFGSFFLTLWLTEPPEPPDPRPDWERLASYRITNYAELMHAANSSRLQMSPQLKGKVDGINRTNHRDVTVEGWLADTSGTGTPLDVVVFLSGNIATRAATAGERRDVTQALRLAFGAEKNVAFRVSFGCRSGEQPIVVGLGGERRYLPLGSGPCP